MSTKTDVEAIRLIGDEVVRLLSLPDEDLDDQVSHGLRLIADLARWKEIAFGTEVTPPALAVSVATPKTPPSEPSSWGS